MSGSVIVRVLREITHALRAPHGNGCSCHPRLEYHGPRRSEARTRQPKQAEKETRFRADRD